MQGTTRKRRKGSGVGTRAHACAEPQACHPQSRFAFDLGRERLRFTDEQLLKGLRAFGATVGGKPFRRVDFAAWARKPFCPQTVLDRFGSWNAALAKIGLDQAPTVRIGTDVLVEALERVWRKLGRAPGVMRMKQYSGISPGPYMRVWGSLRRACEALARHHRGEITRGELLAGDPEKHRRKRMRRIPLPVRWRVLRRDRYRCRLCGRSPATAPIELQIDHVRPMSKGGTNEPSNLRTLCADCNSGRGDGRRGEGRRGEGLRPRKCAGGGDARENRRAPRRGRR